MSKVPGREQQPSGARVSRAARAALTAAKSAIIVCCGVALTSACTHPSPSSGRSTDLAPATIADSLIVSLDDVRSIAGSQELKTDPRGDDHQPRRRDLEAPGPCRVFDPQVAFGSGWTQFRSVIYNGFAKPSLPSAPARTAPDSAAQAPAPRRPLLIIQTVGIYPDVSGARTAFERLIPALTECSALHARHYDFTLNQPNSSTAALDYSNGSKNMYRVKSSTITYVAVAGFSRSEQIADDVLQTITDRIK